MPREDGEGVAESRQGGVRILLPGQPCVVHQAVCEDAVREIQQDVPESPPEVFVHGLVDGEFPQAHDRAVPQAVRFGEVVDAFGVPSVFGHDSVDEADAACFGVEQVPVPVSGLQVRPEPVREALPEAPSVDGGVGLDDVAADEVVDVVAVPDAAGKFADRWIEAFGPCPVLVGHPDDVEAEGAVAVGLEEFYLEAELAGVGEPVVAVAEGDVGGAGRLEEGADVVPWGLRPFAPQERQDVGVSCGVGEDDVPGGIARAVVGDDVEDGEGGLLVEDALDVRLDELFVVVGHGEDGEKGCGVRDGEGPGVRGRVGDGAGDLLFCDGRRCSGGQSSGVRVHLCAVFVSGRGGGF